MADLSIYGAGRLRAGRRVEVTQRRPDPEPDALAKRFSLSVTEERACHSEAVALARDADSGIPTERSPWSGHFMDCLHRERERASEERQREEEDRATAERRAIAARERAKREAAVETARAEVANNPGALRCIRSAIVCLSNVVRTIAKKEIETENKYAREGGGMIDKVKMYRLQQVMRTADEKSSDAKSGLDRMKALPCKDTDVEAVMSCALLDAGDQSSKLQEWRPHCDDLHLAAMVQLAGMKDLLIETSALVERH